MKGKNSVDSHMPHSSGETILKSDCDRKESCRISS